MDYTTVILAISAAILSGVGTAIVAGIRDMAKEKNRRIEREQDHLKLDLKDLKIELYKIEKELTEWKDKYYNAIQDLISVKSELEEALIVIAHAQHDNELDTEF
jgi:MFS superfamily sulfate permease-like transporter